MIGLYRGGHCLRKLFISMVALVLRNLISSPKVRTRTFAKRIWSTHKFWNFLVARFTARRPSIQDSPSLSLCPAPLTRTPHPANPFLPVGVCWDRFRVVLGVSNEENASVFFGHLPKMLRAAGYAGEVRASLSIERRGEGEDAEQDLGGQALEGRHRFGSR
jgi:hypothetical protein